MGLLDSYSISFDHFIGGERVASERSFNDISPIDGSVIAQVSAGGRHEAYLAITAAEKGFEMWSRTKRGERAAIMRTIAALIEERVEVLAMVETIDNGSLLRSHLRSVMPRVAHNFRFFAQFLEEGLDYPDFETRGHKNHVSYDPSGPSLLISPWNAPLMLEYNTVWDKYREPQVLKGGKDYSKHPWKEKYDEEKNRNPVLHLCSY